MSQAVKNNDIQHRIKLELDGTAATSTTAHSTVQPGCINKNLTKKCLIYHNDQWFSYTPNSTESAYVIIQNQKCRDLKGVQLVVLEGDPCKTPSYRLKKCIDFTDRADFFVVLDSLVAGKEYLINVDGFLGDACAFDISIKTQPDGLPMQVPTRENKSLHYSQQDSIITLHWSIDQPDANILRGFFIYRKKFGETKSDELKTPSVLNALGSPARDYSLTDTLHGYGEYTYHIYMNSGYAIVQLQQVTIQHKSPSYFKVFPRYKQQIDFYVQQAGIVRIGIQTRGQKSVYLIRKRCTQGMNSVVVDFSPFIKTREKHFVVTLKSKYIDESRPISFE
jgi:hypothetical protein